MDNATADSLNLLTAALHFAAQQHRLQKRKDQQGSPYINHPIHVLHILTHVGGVHDPIVLAAALLHDVVEDTDASLEKIRNLFGDEVADVVAEVTDDKDLPKAERKRLQIVHTPHMSARAQWLKLADKSANISDLIQHPPADWSLQRKRDYVDWGEQVIAGLRGSHPALEAYFDQLVADARQQLSSAS